MTEIEVLKQIKSLRNEIKGIEAVLNDLSHNTVSDVVSGSSDEFPYQPRHFSVSGVDIHKLNRTQQNLIQKKQQLEKAVQEAERMLENVEDAEIRNILRLRYELGLTWNEVAIKCDSTEAAVRMRAERFLKKFA